MALDQNVLFRNIGILLILNDLDNITRSKSLKTHSRDFNELYSSVKSILNVTLNNYPNIKVRRLGIKLSDLKDNEGQNTMLNFINNNNNNVIDIFLLLGKLKVHQFILYFKGYLGVYI